MKKILITGKTSYIGKSFVNWIEKWPENYSFRMIDVRGEAWKNHDFSKYDIVLHLAAIVHVNEKNSNNYYLINSDLTFEIAQKAKKSGISQFIFLSTMGVYGLDKGKIYLNSKENPTTHYAKSKLEAEKRLSSLKSENFKVLILRPPIVYGPNCKGNYSRLSNLSKKIRFFPIINNLRSMIFIDNLSEFIRLSIERKIEGLHFPSNIDYVNISDLINEISKINGNRVFFTKYINFFVHLFMPFSSTFKKVFGSYVYSYEMINRKDINANEYSTCNFNESILFTEKNKGNNYV